MSGERWEVLSGWLNRWLAADAAERDRLRAALAAEHPDLLEEAGALAAASGEIGTFLETPALIVEAAALAAEEASLTPGGMVGPYRVAGLLARGGMGDVYRATDTRLQRDVALKILAQTKTGDPLRVERFAHEARVTASLNHPNVVRVYDVGQIDDRAYLVAELLQGETLRARIARGPLPPSEAVRIAADIARGLVAAHAAGLVHRDLKPDNVFLTDDGATKILDFGIAKLSQDESVRDGLSTMTGVVLGTAGYLSPEQIRGETVDARADLFALGSVLFEMLSGERAFAREHLVETLHAIIHDPSPPLHGVQPALAAIVRRLLEKVPAARFRSAADVIAALEAIEAPERVPLSTRVTGHVTRALPRRAGRRATAVAVTVLLVAAVAGWAAYKWRANSPAAGTATVSLAVMPFRIIPAASEGDLLDLGLAEVFISRLSQLQGVRVLPSTATSRLRNQDPIAAARQFGATHVLTVTLQRDSGRVRATPQLLAASGDTLWSSSFDTDATKIFAIQDIIVTKVVEELAPKLSAGMRNRIAAVRTRNNAAYEAYVNGRASVLTPTRADLSRAEAFFKRAVELDPSYADAWAGLGSAYKRMPIASAAPAPEAFPRAKLAAERALQLEPDHAEATSVLGTVAFWYDWDYPGAERLLRRAIELQPSSPDSELFLAHLLANTARFDEALVEIARARALDPSWSLARAQEGHFLFMAGKYDDALQVLDDAIRLDPTSWPARTFKTLTLLAMRRYEDALRECDALAQIRRPDGVDFAGQSHKAYALARMGRTAEATQIADALQRRAIGRSGTAAVLHALGRDEEAFTMLDRAIDSKELGVTFLGVYPWWDDVRGNPAFEARLSRVHLLDVSHRVR